MKLSFKILMMVTFNGLAIGLLGYYASIVFIELIGASIYTIGCCLTFAWGQK